MVIESGEKTWHLYVPEGLPDELLDEIVKRLNDFIDLSDNPEMSEKDFSRQIVRRGLKPVL